MKETASHSNTPVFAENHSCTKPVLHQHPTQAEMRPSRLAVIWANAKDFAVFIATALVLWFIVTMVIMAMFGGGK